MDFQRVLRDSDSQVTKTLHTRNYKKDCTSSIKSV